MLERCPLNEEQPGLRRLAAGDMPALMRLVEAAQWNQLPSDWQRMLDLAGDLAVGCEIKGRIVASAVALAYEPRLVWMGMVLTLPEFRGRKLASRLLEHLLERLPEKGPADASIYLDATHLGEEIYRRYGFVEEGVIRRWVGRMEGESNTASGTWNGVLDRAAFGADRSALLHSFAREAKVWQSVEGGYGMLRPGRRFAYWGPVVAQYRDSAEWLCRQALAGAGEVAWDILEENQAAVKLAAQLGWQPFRRLVRMRRGPAIERERHWEYGIAGFEYG
ncbi:MAG: GNAT family N-acetyltransferase [Bryobacter sp.]|nr:GNAT family N-acetyltransferase [Bryobacter sp.]